METQAKCSFFISRDYFCSKDSFVSIGLCLILPRWLQVLSNAQNYMHELFGS